MIDEKIFSNERSKKYFINPGKKEKIIKHGVVGADGVIRLVKDGVEDIQEKIQSYEPSTNIYNIINSLSQDNMLMYADQAGKFIDSTDMPKTYAEALQLVIDGQNAFMKLPLEVRQKFDNDFNKWFATAGSPEWMNKIGYKPVEKNVVTGSDDEEVKE